MQRYTPKAIEKKWQKYWEEKKVFKLARRGGGQYAWNLPRRQAGKKFYVLDMFPYPSGAGLHVGHPKGYIATDVVARMKQLEGYGVLHPMGWDAFGLPAEQFALKHKIHPSVSVKKNVATFKKQLEKIGFTYDWDREIYTTDPEYYKWTQWIFLQLYKKGLAYQSWEPINWCPSCQTGLANEDLEQGKCERCGSQVEQRPMRQWVLKMTAYADRLLYDLDTCLPGGQEEKLDWNESIKEQQRNWIGRSEGMLFTAPVKGMDLNIQTFSAHLQAFAADTFVVIAPDHPLLPKLLKGIKDESKILAVCGRMVKERNTLNYGETREMEGIFTGRYIVDPVGNGDLPIWVANYAVESYGTGIVKCSAHDERDFAFAKKYHIHLKPVLFPADPEEIRKVEKLEYCYSDMQNGILTEPKVFEGQKSGDCREAIIQYLKGNKLAIPKINYKMRDWVFSRQRYWGEPIPIIHCEKCGVVPVPEKDLPVKLPNVKSYVPTGTGESPLAAIAKWVNVKCPRCGGKAKRETNTMPQWAGSSWYYLAYIMKGDSKFEIRNSKLFRQWLPVDLYVGGAEHATRHLLYARFWHKFLYDIGAVSTTEPFHRLVNVGLILASDGRKMSKRWGNVVNPDEMVARFGADAFRLYEMFMGPFTQSVAWNTDGVVGMRRFLEKVWTLQSRINPPAGRAGNQELRIKQEKSRIKNEALETLLNKTIKKVSEDIEGFRFNTAISSLMILANEMEKEKELSLILYSQFLILFSPFAPHMAEELWSRLGHKKSLFLEAAWPKADPRYLFDTQVEIVVQVNGKLRARLKVSAGLSQSEVEEMALGDDNVKAHTDDKQIRKVIFVQDRLVNFVVQ